MVLFQRHHPRFNSCDYPLSAGEPAVQMPSSIHHREPRAGAVQAYQSYSEHHQRRPSLLGAEAHRSGLARVPSAARRSWEQSAVQGGARHTPSWSSRRAARPCARHTLRQAAVGCWDAVPRHPCRAGRSRPRRQHVRLAQTPEGEISCVQQAHRAAQGRTAGVRHLRLSTQRSIPPALPPTVRPDASSRGRATLRLTPPGSLRRRVQAGGVMRGSQAHRCLLFPRPRCRRSGQANMQSMPNTNSADVASRAPHRPHDIQRWGRPHKRSPNLLPQTLTTRARRRCKQRAPLAQHRALLQRYIPRGALVAPIAEVALIIHPARQ